MGKLPPTSCSTCLIPIQTGSYKGPFVLQTTAEAEGIELSGIVDSQDLGFAGA